MLVGNSIFVTRIRHSSIFWGNVVDSEKSICLEWEHKYGTVIPQTRYNFIVASNLVLTESCYCRVVYHKVFVNGGCHVSLKKVSPPFRCTHINRVLAKVDTGFLGSGSQVIIYTKIITEKKILSYPASKAIFLAGWNTNFI